MLIGIDLRKPKAQVEAAYDDSRGVTARFNLNLLARINREIGGRFDLDRFRHRAFYDEEAGRIEMHLVSAANQSVTIEGAGLTVSFRKGEPIHTEDSSPLLAGRDRRPRRRQPEDSASSARGRMPRRDSATCCFPGGDREADDARLPPHRDADAPRARFAGPSAATRSGSSRGIG